MDGERGGERKVVVVDREKSRMREGEGAGEVAGREPRNW